MPRFFAYLVSTLNFKCSGKEWASYVKDFWSYWLRKMCLFKRITGFPSENTLAVDLWTSPKNSWNLQESDLIILFHHSELNWVRESSFSSDLKFQDCLITRWLLTMSILVVIERIYRYHLKSNYLKKHKVFVPLSFIFSVSTLNFQSSEKKMSIIEQVLTSKDVLI